VSLYASAHKLIDAYDAVDGAGSDEDCVARAPSRLRRIERLRLDALAIRPDEPELEHRSSSPGPDGRGRKSTGPYACGRR
jgi:hypothetical protein